MVGSCRHQRVPTVLLLAVEGFTGPTRLGRASALAASRAGPSEALVLQVASTGLHTGKGRGGKVGSRKQN